jgi:hypothetical protein
MRVPSGQVSRVVCVGKQGNFREHFPPQSESAPSLGAVDRGQEKGVLKVKQNAKAEAEAKKVYRNEEAQERGAIRW